MKQCELPYQKHSETSKAAAVQAEKRAPLTRQAVFSAIARKGEVGATDQEVEDWLGMDGSSVRPRRRELQLEGRVVDSGMKRFTRSGGSAVVWVATARSITEVRDDRLCGEG